ncbi:MAG: hypothetical protein WD768_22250 [Phycisphaeraceae bacterium]
MSKLDTAGVAATESTALAATPRLAANWIIGPRVDLLCFIGAAALGYGMFFLHAGLAMDMVGVWFIWYMFLDSPHFFGTYARTYLDKEEMAARRKLLIGSIGLLAVGPVFIAICAGLWAANVSWYKTPFMVLTAFVSIWAYWHVVRQHYGIMSLYKRKNHDGEMLDRRLDQWGIYLGLMAPFVAFAVTNNEARVALGLSQALDGTPGGMGMIGAITKPYVAGQGWEAFVVKATMLTAGLALGLVLIRSVIRWQRGATVNMPKLMFLCAVIPLHMVVCYHPASTTIALLGFSACVTIFHDVQYHAIVWYHQRNRMGKAGDAKHERFGLAAKISRNFPTYAACAIGMGLTLGFLGCLLDVNPGCIPVIGSRSHMLFGNLSWNEVFFGIFLGVLMHHYFVDQFIWRPSKDKNLQKDLKLEGDGASR